MLGEQLETNSIFDDRYRIQSHLGSGGMGTVFRAHDLALDEQVALKLMTTLGSLQAVLRFREEVRLARRVTHPNVARVHDVGEVEGQLYLTMEYVEGETLTARLRGQKLELDETLRIGLALATALGAAHAAGVVHRDVKPSNVLLGSRGRVVVTDFGVACSVSDAADRPAELVGTMRYMSPEQARGLHVDARTDVYALGVLLYELLVGKRPAMGAPHSRKRLEECGASGPIADLIARCLEVEATRRPASGSEVEEVLREHFHVDDAATASGVHMTPDVAPTTVRFPPLPSPTVEPTIAVFAFNFKGDSNKSHWAEGVAEELVDVLSRTRGLRTLGFQAAAAFREEDPRTAGALLGADYLIRGTFNIRGEQSRLKVQLVDAASGEQIWSDKFEGPIGDLWEFQERVAKRVAENLRVELSVRSYRVPDEAVDCLFSARRLVRHFLPPRQSGALAMLERALELAPDFEPALAAHAWASTLLWFDLREPHSEDQEQQCKGSVERALAQASALSETHYAAASFENQRGQYGACLRELDHAIAIAPTNPNAHQSLGALECEMDDSARGLVRLRMAVELDPSLVSGFFVLAKQYAQQGRPDQAEEVLARLCREQPGAITGATILRCRLATWRRDGAAVERLRQILMSTAPGEGPVTDVCRMLVGEMSPSVERGGLIRFARWASPRSVAYGHQIGAEVCGFLEEWDHAFDHLERLAGSVFLDLGWLKHCPIFDPVCARPRFQAVLETVRRRVDAARQW